MIIRFEWCETGRRGWMEYDADVMIRDMPMTGYKKWVKLFAIYGTSQQHNEFLSLIKTYYWKAYEELNVLLGLNDTKGVKKIKDTMKKYDRKYEILLRLL